MSGNVIEAEWTENTTEKEGKCQRYLDPSLMFSEQVKSCTKVVDKIASVVHTGKYSDVTLVVNGQKFLAHRLILCISSEVFQAMLMNRKWKESTEEEVVLTEEGECAFVFRKFLHYMYSGAIELRLDNVIHVLMLADKYMVQELKQLCGDYMIRQISRAADYNYLIQWFKVTFLFRDNYQHISEAICNYMKWNFDVILERGIEKLDLDHILFFLRCDDIVVPDEYTLYRGLIKWLSVQHSEDGKTCNEEDMRNLVFQTMSYIRFPMLTMQQIGDLIIQPLSQKYKEYFMETIAIAMAINNDGSDAMTDHLVALIATHTNKQKLRTPRLYTNTWSTVFVVDGFKYIENYQSKSVSFSTPGSIFESEGKKTEMKIDWIIELYPKGVHFKKSAMIVWQGRVELPGEVFKIFRVSIQYKCKELQRVRVRIGIMFIERTEQTEYIKHVQSLHHVFTAKDNILNLDHVLSNSDFNETDRKKHKESAPDSSNTIRKSRGVSIVDFMHSVKKMRITIVPVDDRNRNVPV